MPDRGCLRPLSSLREFFHFNFLIVSVASFLRRGCGVYGAGDIIFLACYSGVEIGIPSFLNIVR